MKYLQVAFIFIFLTYSVACQDCVTPGKYCTDDKACCGGCCRNQICTNTYDPCSIKDDLCLRHVCSGRMECVIFQPECSGCEAIAMCSESSDSTNPFVPPQPSNMRNSNYFEYLHSNTNSIHRIPVLTIFVTIFTIAVSK